MLGGCISLGMGSPQMEPLEGSRTPVLELPHGGEQVTFSPCTAPPSFSPPPPLPSRSPVCWQQKMPRGQRQHLCCYWSSSQLGSAFGVGEKRHTHSLSTRDMVWDGCAQGAWGPGRGQQFKVLPCSGFPQPGLSRPSPKGRCCCTKGCDLVKTGSTQHSCLKHPGSVGPFPSPPFLRCSLHFSLQPKAEQCGNGNEPPVTQGCPALPEKPSMAQAALQELERGDLSNTRALCCPQPWHWPSLLCHGAGGLAQSGLHLQRRAGWVFLKSCFLFDFTSSLGKFTPQGSHLKST